MRISILLYIVLTICSRAAAQGTAVVLPLTGRWEVVQYAEQGFQVDKKKPALPQAVEVYRHVQKERARTWYGYDYEAADEYSKRRAREFERWEARDSTKEVTRIAEAIETPYFAVFFADSTLSLYNKDAATGRIAFPESRRFVFSPATMSLDLYPPGFLPGSNVGWVDKWDVQVLFLSENRMTLFLPQEAEIVELVRTEFKLP
jgi:hypothetical protein